MKAISIARDTQEMSRRFNDEEAVWLAYRRKRLTRSAWQFDPSLAVLLDHLDRLEAERETRMTYAAGNVIQLSRRND